MEEDHLFHLNYAITLFSNDEFEKARAPMMMHPSDDAPLR